MGVGKVPLVLACIIATACALFEDQVGKFDWRHRSVGCPTHMAFDRSHSGTHDAILLTSRERAIASLSLNTGDIYWRRLQEGNGTGDMPFIALDDVLVTSSDEGRSIRAWSKATGGLKWNAWTGDTPCAKPSLASFGKQVVVLTGHRLQSISTNDGTTKWTATVPKGDFAEIVSVIPLADSSSSVTRQDVTLVTGIDGLKVTLSPLDSKGISDVVVTKQADWFNSKRCILSSGALWCISPTGTLHSLPIGSGKDAAQIAAFLGTLSPVDVPFSVAIVSQGETAVFTLRSDKLVKAVSIPGRVDALTGTAVDGGEGVVVAASSTHTITVHETKTGKLIAKATLPSAPFRPPFISLVVTRPVLASPTEWHITAVTKDCRIESYVVDANTNAAPSLEWAREEALARASHVEMIDLPLSELQASIEDEFEGGDVGPLGAFLRRISTQAHQVKRWAIQSLNQAVSLTSALSFKQGTLSEIIEAIRSSEGSRNGGSRGTALERDFFNMRRLIILTTLDGVVLGLDNADGRVLWRLSLDEGGRFAPLQTMTSSEAVPLFVQRSTVHPGFNGIVAVVHKDKETGEGVIVTLDPMTGALLGRQRTTTIKRVDVLPAHGPEHVHSLVVIEKSGKVHFFPPVPSSVADKLPPLHVLDVDANTGHLEGSTLSPSSGRLQTRWSAELGFEAGDKVVAIKGKPAHQRVHSRGRVLIDRNVQYKYINPNLVAIATLNEVHQSFSLHLVDAVSGQIVHTARAPKVTGPIHVVHCEHWVAYSYWSEKSRRTELGILELYEGQEQPPSNTFDSHVPTRQKPEAVVQSYIFSQGIQAMGVSETEQGATTRSLVMALPFGGLFEVTRRFVDATRPQELTQEMREEMMIPYIPEIPISTEEMVNYNQTVFGIREIKSFPSGLESTSLMLAYGMDMFYTRLTPSGTFDILKDEFDYGLISIVLAALFIGSYVAKRIVKRNSIKAAWA